MNPVNGPVVVVLLLAIVTLAALWRSEAMSARTWRQRAEQLDTPIDLWSVSNVNVTDDWPPAVREWTEAAARDRHPVGKGRAQRVWLGRNGVGGGRRG